MAGRFFFFTAFSMSILFFVQGPSLCAEPADLLKNAEADKWYPERARNIYQQLSESHPGSEYTLEAGRNLVISYILAESDDDAQAVLNDVISKFSGQSRLSSALYEIALLYERLRKYDRAEDLYNRISQQYPATTEAVKVQISPARMQILRYIDRKDAAAVTAVEKLVTDFADHPELASSIYDIARRYERAKDYDNARSIYQTILQQFPQSPAAGKAALALRRTQCLNYIESGDLNAGRQAVEGMIGDFTSHPDFPEALYDIAIRYERKRHYNDAKDIYQRIIRDANESSHGCRARLDTAKIDFYLLIEAGKTNSVMPAIDEIVSEFSGHSCLHQALADIAKRCEWAKDFTTAVDVYKQIEELNLQTGIKQQAKMNRRKCEIMQLISTGDYDETITRVSRLAADFSSDEQIAWAVKQIANQLYNKVFELEETGLSGQVNSCLQQAVLIYEIILNDLPATTANAEATYFAADCYRRLDRLPKAIEYYQKVVDDYSYYNKSWEAQFRIGDCYEKMCKTGLMTKDEAVPKIKSAYQKLVEEYPDCAMAGYAADWLSNYSAR